MSPRPFNPMQRAREFTRTPNPRRMQLSATQEIMRLRRQMRQVADLAVQPDASTSVEILNELPEPTAEDVGREIILMLPGETTVSRYSGIQLSDNSFDWLLLGVSGDAPSGGGGGLTFTFNAHLTGFAGGLDGIVNTGDVSSGIIHGMHTGAGNNPRFNKATGATTIEFAGIPASGFVFDNTGDRYVADPANSRVRRYSSLASLEQTTPTARNYQRLAHLSGSANLYASAGTEGTLLRLTMTTLAIAATIATPGNSPDGVAVDSAGNVYVALWGNHTVRKYSSAGTLLATLGTAGTASAADGQFNAPRGMAIDSGDRLYVADTGNNRVQVFNVALTTPAFLAKFGTSGSGNGQFTAPRDVSVIGADVAVADYGNARVSRWIRT